MWLCVVGWVVPDVSKGLIFVTPNNEGDTFLRNVGNHPTTPRHSLEDRNSQKHEHLRFFFLYSYLLGNSKECGRDARHMERIGVKCNVWTVLTYLHFSFSSSVIQTLLLCGTRGISYRRKYQNPRPSSIATSLEIARLVCCYYLREEIRKLKKSISVILTNKFTQLS
jgi:hypothetical protein